MAIVIIGLSLRMSVQSDDIDRPLYTAGRYVCLLEDLTVKLLVDNDVPHLHLSNGDGETPLTLAVARGEEEIAAILYNSGFDPNLSNADGETPLSLIKHGVNPEMKDVFVDGRCDH